MYRQMVRWNENEIEKEKQEINEGKSKLFEKINKINKLWPDTYYQYHKYEKKAHYSCYK